MLIGGLNETQDWNILGSEGQSELIERSSLCVVMRIIELTDINTAQLSLADGHRERITELTTRNAELAALKIAHEERIDFLSERNLLLAEQRVRFEAELIEAQEACETVPAEGLFYLHADHLGPSAICDGPKRRSRVGHG